MTGTMFSFQSARSLARSGRDCRFKQALREMKTEAEII
jgi:hypothetical protein